MRERAGLDAPDRVLRREPSFEHPNGKPEDREIVVRGGEEDEPDARQALFFFVELGSRPPRSSRSSYSTANWNRPGDLSASTKSRTAWSGAAGDRRQLPE